MATPAMPASRRLCVHYRATIRTSFVSIYKRNTIDVQGAVDWLRAYKGQIKAVIMIASYRAAAKFIEKTRDLYPSMIYDLPLRFSSTGI